MVDAPLPELSLGWQAAHWIETLLCHGPGDVEGEPVVLDADFLEALVRAYAVSPEVGRRLIRRYILSRAKGRAKSEFAGFLGCLEALGPARFDHWAVKGETSWWGYEYEPGEPVGRPVKRPFIRCLATEEMQTGNTYDNIRFILTSDKARIAEEIPGIDAGLTRTFLPNMGGEIRPSSASSVSKDGGKETFAVFDETHLYVLPDLKAMARMVRRNTAKRAECWTIETTTMFEEGADSTAEATFTAAEKGQLRSDVVFDHVEGPDPETFDWDDDDQLRAALRVAYAPAEWVDLDAKLADIRDVDSPKHESIRYFLNRRSSTESDIVDLGAWDRFRVADSIKAGEKITAGFDGSERDDGTAISIVRGSDGLTDKWGLWENPGGPVGKSWKVPRAAVKARVAEMFDRFHVVRFYCDPRYWETDIDEWALEFGVDIVLEVPHSEKREAKMADRWDSLVANAVQQIEAGVPLVGLSHTGDPDLRRHIANAKKARIGARGGIERGWKPVKKRHDRKIDLTSSAMLGHEARGDAIAAGELVEGPPPGDLFIAFA